MAKISIDVDEIKKNLKIQALNAKTQITDLAKKARTDLEANQVFKKVENVLERVKANEYAQELMKNPKVQDLAKRLVAASEQLEKAIAKNATSILDEVRARVNKPAPAAKAKKSKKNTSPDEN